MRIWKAALAAIGSAAFVLAGTAMQPAVAAETEWKMHLVWVPTRQEAATANAFVERVNTRAKGKLKISMFTGGSLGVKDQDMLRILPPGNAVQITMLYPGYVARDAPDLAYALPEGVLAKAEDMITSLKTLDGIYGPGFEKRGIKYLGTFVSPDKSISIYCKQPVSSLEQLKTKKLRVWSKPLADSFAKLGVAATIIPQNDMYIALQTGVVDCATYYPGAANTLSLQEVAPYWSFLSNYAVPIPLVISQRSWAALPPDVQAILTEEANRMVEELSASFLAGSYEAAEGKKFDSRGGKMLDPFPQADQAAFTNAAATVWADMSKNLGGQVLENYNALVGVLRK